MKEVCVAADEQRRIDALRPEEDVISLMAAAIYSGDSRGGLDRMADAVDGALEIRKLTKIIVRNLARESD